MPNQKAGQPNAQIAQANIPKMETVHQMTSNLVSSDASSQLLRNFSTPSRVAFQLRSTAPPAWPQDR